MGNKKTDGDENQSMLNNELHILNQYRYLR